MAKNKKPVDVQKKKLNVAASGDATNGKFKNKTGELLRKKQKNKKNKKAGDYSSAIKSPILTEKAEPIIDVAESNGQETNKSSPGKNAESKKGKNIILDESVAAKVLSNPEIVKKKSKKEIVKAVVKPSSPKKTKKMKGGNQKDKQEENVEEMVETVVEPQSPKKKKKKKGGVQKDQQEENVLQENQTETNKKRKNSTTADEDDGPEEEQVSDKKRKKSKATGDKDEGTDASPKKRKSKEAKTDNDTKSEDKTPSVSVFVGNLPVNTKRAKILKLFSKFGKVKSIRFRLSNGVKFFKSQSKVTSPNVIAFVDYESEEDAKSSLVLNGEKIKDNVIRVNLQSNAKKADSFDGKRTVFVGNLKYSVTDQNLHDLFSCCGDIEYARTMQCDKGCNGIGYVCFKKSESIGMALELNNADLQGRPVRVQRYVKKTPGGPKEKKNKKEKSTGAVRRLGKKQKVKTSNGNESNAKKSFTGMKAKEKKKGFVKKNKKPLKGPKLLAKKIASRDQTTKVTKAV